MASKNIIVLFAICAFLFGAVLVLTQLGDPACVDTIEVVRRNDFSSIVASIEHLDLNTQGSWKARFNTGHPFKTSELNAMFYKQISVPEADPNGNIYSFMLSNNSVIISFGEDLVFLGQFQLQIRDTDHSRQ